jgi:hypothetical protein
MTEHYKQYRFGAGQGIASLSIRGGIRREPLRTFDSAFKIKGGTIRHCRRFRRVLNLEFWRDLSRPFTPLPGAIGLNTNLDFELFEAQMTENSTRIFLSCGVPDNGAQELFLSSVEAHLKSHKCEPQTVGRSKYSGRQPVQAARDLIAECDGAFVIAFERTRILRGIERPAGAKPTNIDHESHPTVWNQMEASMAYAQRVPILTIVQRGLKRQGMLSARLEWVAIEGDLDPSLLGSEEFRQIFDEWLSLVRAGNEKKKPAVIDLTELRIGHILQMKPAQLYTIIASVFGLLSTVAILSFKLGQHAGIGS